MRENIREMEMGYVSINLVGISGRKLEVNLYKNNNSHQNHHKSHKNNNLNKNNKTTIKKIQIKNNNKIQLITISPTLPISLLKLELRQLQPALEFN
jgi:hypothetical protein